MTISDEKYLNIPFKLKPIRIRSKFDPAKLYDINLAILAHCENGDLTRMLGMKQFGAVNARSLRVHICIIGSPGDFDYVEALCNGWDASYDVSMIEMRSCHPVPKINGYYLWLMNSGLQACWHGRVDDDSLTDLSAAFEYLDLRFGDCSVHVSTHPLLELHLSPNFAKYIKDRDIELRDTSREYESSFTSHRGMESIFSNSIAYRMIVETGELFEAPGDVALAMAAHIAGVPVVPNAQSQAHFHPDRFSVFGGTLHHIHYVPWTNTEVFEPLSAFSSRFESPLTAELIDRLLNRYVCYHRGFRATALLTMRPNGTIVGGEGEDIYRWAFSDSTLSFVSNTGKLVASFTSTSSFNGEPVAKGFGLRTETPLWLRIPSPPESSDDFLHTAVDLAKEHIDENDGVTQRKLRQSLTKALCSSAHIYYRIGYDSRFMTFSPDGQIHNGAAANECSWKICFDNDLPTLHILDQKNDLTCQLELHADAIWRGSWQRFERMPVAIFSPCNEEDRTLHYALLLSSSTGANDMPSKDDSTNGNSSGKISKPIKEYIALCGGSIKAIRHP